MAIAKELISPPTPTLTYEQYLVEGEVNRRYDILDGVRYFMADPTRQHQRIIVRFVRAFGNFEDASSAGQVITAPSDVLITRIPLRTRQPDVLFISHARLQQCKPANDPDPLLIGPELVVEIISPSDTSKALNAKIKDYCSVDVLEFWAVHPIPQTVEVLRLTRRNSQSIAVYKMGDIVQSLTFPDLKVAVADIFAE